MSLSRHGGPSSLKVMSGTHLLQGEGKMIVRAAGCKFAVVSQVADEAARKALKVLEEGWTEFEERLSGKASGKASAQPPLLESQTPGQVCLLPSPDNSCTLQGAVSIKLCNAQQPNALIADTCSRQSKAGLSTQQTCRALNAGAAAGHEQPSMQPDHSRPGRCRISQTALSTQQCNC